MSSLVRCATRNGLSANSLEFSQVNSTHKVETRYFLKCLTICLFPEDVHVASNTTLSAQASQNRSKHVITCQSNLPFCVDKEKKNPAKPHPGLPQASHGIAAYPKSNLKYQYQSGQHFLQWQQKYDFSNQPFTSFIQPKGFFFTMYVFCYVQSLPLL